MMDDFGTIKAVMPMTTQASPTASSRRTEAVDATRQPVRTAAEAKEAERDPQPLADVVQQLNQLVRELHRELHFSVDEASGDTVIKVVDRETDEVVRQIPSEEVMRLRKRLQEAAGMIFHDSA